MTNDINTIPIGLLTGKVVFITGASRGIGAAAARLFAREGAAVVLAARSADALDRVVAEIRAHGGVADAVALDLADRVSIRVAVDRVEELHGRLDGAFNNGAAIQPPGFPRALDRHDRRGCADAAGRRRGDRQHLEHRQSPCEPGAPRVRCHEARAQQHHRDGGRDLGS
jgi:NAD(P)-dependent dehydrogenase (short-subunit alcohol dehydrogenase family)